jgi:NAD(P)-dependent dehydrogenase (short-subunit alcohol dehydrogenase family)
LRESELELKPMYDASHYKGSEKLMGKVALITGADSGIGRAVAVLFAREGADVAIANLNEHDDAEETKAAIENEGRLLKRFVCNRIGGASDQMLQMTPNERVTVLEAQRRFARAQRRRRNLPSASMCSTTRFVARTFCATPTG